MEVSLNVRIIAEVGENHLGDLDRALELVRLAARAGADFVKFQSYAVEDLRPNIEEDTRRWIEQTQLSREDHVRLRDEAKDVGIEFLSTAVNVGWASFLRDLGCRRLKLASLSLTNPELLQFAGENFDEVFVSTGMGDVAEIDAALEALGNRTGVVLLHCVSEYPTPDDHASLRSIEFMRDHFGVPVGYSDHTIGTTACLLACGLGVELIEKHFTLDKSLEGTDHILSADPAELTSLVRRCRRIQVLLGDCGKQPTPQEISQREHVRSLFQE